MKTLHDTRKTIDAIDRKLLSLLADRMRAVQEVGAIKRETGAAPLRDDAREHTLYAAWTAEGERLGLSGYFVGRILREVLDYSRRDQERLLGVQHGPETARVAYLGGPGAYGELALSKLFTTRGAELAAHGLKSFTACVDALEAGDVDYAFLPIENTIAGSINEVYELLARRKVHIVDEEEWDVEHCLVGLPGARAEGVTVVRSHPVALQQCRRYLGSLVGCAEQAVTSTADAAREVAEAQDASLAAIASEEAARRHGLEVLARDVADRKHNRTRFLLIALEPEAPEQSLLAKTSVLFTLNHRHGALAEALQVFAEAGANLSKLESRPLGDTPWEYLFYLDVDGHAEDAVLARALAGLRPHTNHLRVLGTYPRRSGRGELAVPVDVAPPADAPEVDVPQRAIDVFSLPGLESTESPAATPCELPAPGAAPPKPGGMRLAWREPENERTVVRVGSVEIGGDRFALIAGPCAVESKEQIGTAAELVRRSGAVMLRGGAYKPRTSPYSFQGLGEEGVRLLADAGRTVGLPVVTEVLRPEDVAAVAEEVDVLQVGARNMQNFALLGEVGRTQRPVLLKRGLSATIEELLLAAEYILAAGNHRVILCERGIRTFETATRATLDIAAVPVLKARTHLPVIVDPSHAAGVRELVLPLAWAAAAAGADGLIVEMHPRPEEALCDKEQALRPQDLDRLARGLDPILRAQGRTR